MPPPLFTALLTPHRSLSRRGVRRVVAVAAVLAAIPGVAFVLMGAWPVVGLLGLGVSVLWWALSASLASGRTFEEVRLWRDGLVVRHVGHRGAERRHEFNPFWVRFEIVRDMEDRVVRMVLRARGEAVEIGSFLTPADKDRFARAFAPALSRARG